MNLFIKKLLAKYITYVEVIGYGLVLLFIAGLVAVSFIKAEDEVVYLKGVYDIPTMRIQFPRKQLILESHYDAFKAVQVGDCLMTLTDDEEFIADQAIIKHLKNQIHIAREQSDQRLLDTFTSLLSEMENRIYPDMRSRILTASVSGDYFPMKKTGEIVSENALIGSIFDFNHLKIHVSTLPVDGQKHQKLVVNQTGSATVSLRGQVSVSFPVEMISHREDGIIFQVLELDDKKKQILADAFLHAKDNAPFPTDISVVVGSKSWLNLILQ